MITSKKLSNQKKISHGFFNKNGGRSRGIYKSLNCGPGSNDKKNNVKENLKIVHDKISKESKNIFCLHKKSCSIIVTKMHPRFSIKPPCPRSLLHSAWRLSH